MTRASQKLRQWTFVRILRLVRPEWRSLTVGTIFLAIGAGAQLSFPQAMKWMLDHALVTHDAASVWRSALVMALIFVVQSFAFGIRYVLFANAGERVVARLRNTLYEHLLKQEIAFYDEVRTGDLTHRLAADTTVLQTTVSGALSVAVGRVALVIGGVCFLFYTSVSLTLLMLAVVPPAVLVAMFFGGRVRRFSREAQAALAEANQRAEETFGGIRTVRAFSGEAREVQRYAASVRGAFVVAVRRAFANGIWLSVDGVLGYLSGVVVLLMGTRKVIDGELTVGSLTAFLAYTAIIVFSLVELGDTWAEVMKASGASDRLFELLDRTPAMALSGGLSPATVDGALRLEGVSFAYPTRAGTKALDEVSFSVGAGEFVALVGASGAGKSTIAALLMRLYDPQEGRLLLDGHHLASLDPGWLRRQVGTVSQEPLLFSCSIADNIRYGRVDATDAEVERAAIAAHADEFTRAFPEGYATRVGERGQQLSGGQKQRVAIARAVLMDPRVLVLDEATSALDAESEHLVNDALDRLMRGRTTLVIAHRLSTVVHADRVIVLEGGRVVQNGTHRELLAEPGPYRRLVERQFVDA